MIWLRPSNSTPYSSCLSLSPKTRESAVATPRTRSYLENIVCYFVILKQSFILEARFRFIFNSLSYDRWYIYLAMRSK